MKKVSAVVSLLSLLVGLNAQAAVAKGYTSCSNGNIEKVGDNHFEVNILEDGLQFTPYESGFMVDAASVVVKNDTYTIADKSVAFASEGTKSFRTVNAILVFDGAKRKLQVSLSYDKGPFNTYELSCVQK